MERIGNDIRRELSRFGPAAQLGEIVARWAAAVGSGISGNAWPARIQRDGTLIVHASSATWAFELTQLESQVRESLGELAPPRLRFVPGPLPASDSVSPAEATREAVAVSPEDRAAGASVAAKISDENLRKLVARAAAASLSQARSARSV
jgi:hypothetical protein